MSRRKRKSAGAPAPEAPAAPLRLHVLEYGAQGCREISNATLAEATYPEPPGGVRWVTLCGLQDTQAVAEVCNAFGLHALTQEDVLDTHQRPKLEEYERYLYIETHACSLSGDALAFQTEQVGIILMEQTVLVFLEGESRMFDALRERARNASGRLRRLGADYLAYALLDVVVDNYFTVLERMSDHMEDIEEDLLQSPSNDTLAHIHTLKRQILLMHRSFWPLREVLSALSRSESPLVSDALAPYLRDLFDHIVQVIETAETMRDFASGLLDAYLSHVSHRLNEIMKVLTIISTVFMPLSFVAGVYGMNFVHMPELLKPWAYPAVLVGMALIALAMMLYFKKKKWW